MSEQLMLFTEGSHVSPSPWLVTGRDGTTLGTCGLSFRGWSEKLARVGLLLRTYLESSPLPPTTSARIWSVSATASGFGILKLWLSARRIGGQESFLWRTPDAGCGRGAQSPERFAESQRLGRPLVLNDQVAHLYPTPRCCSGKRSGGANRSEFYRLWATPKAGDAIIGATARTSGRSPEKTTHLAAQVHIFPTPRAANGMSQHLRNPENIKDTSRLEDFVACLYPTPTVRGNYNRKGMSKNSGDGLHTHVMKMLPTPTANDAKNNGSDSQGNRNSDALNVVAGGALNPDWVEWLMGFPRGWTEVSGDASPKMSPEYPEESRTGRPG